MKIIKRKKSPINIFSLSQICRAIRIFRQKNIKDVTNQMLVDFCILLILNNDIEINNLEIPEPIQTYLLELPEEPESDDNKFFYLDSESLSKFMAIIHAASIINLPLCIWGDPGVGKTAMIRSFGRIREKKIIDIQEAQLLFKFILFTMEQKLMIFLGLLLSKKEEKYHL